MNLSVCAVHDSKAECFHTPIFVRNPGQAVRWFQGLCGDDKHEFAQFPEDYVLYELGTFEDSSGEFTSMSAPRPIVRAAIVRADILKARNGPEVA